MAGELPGLPAPPITPETLNMGKLAGEEAYGEAGGGQDPGREGDLAGPQASWGSSWKKAEPRCWNEDGVQGLGAVAKETLGVKLGFGALFSPWDQGVQAQTLIPRGRALGRKGA